jgi:alkylation response protein AidB-like acyl-CoA dehydrogenase
MNSISSTYGNFHAHFRAATALADSAGEHADRLYSQFGSSLEQRATLKSENRGEFAEDVAAIKVVTMDTGLRITSGMFKVTGSRATTARFGLDRFWRDIRTHALYDPIAYKNRERGRYHLLGEHPEPTWYT